LLQQQNVWFYQQNVWLLRQNFWLQQQKKLFVGPNFVAVTKPFFSRGNTPLKRGKRQIAHLLNKILSVSQ